MERRVKSKLIREIRTHARIGSELKSTAVRLVRIQPQFGHFGLCRAILLRSLILFLWLIAGAANANEMIRLPGGTFEMGSEKYYREEGPTHTVTVGPFLIGQTEVTNAQFRAFVEATGYLTTAERGLDPADRPDWPPELLEPGSMVFAQPAEPVHLDDPNRWWRWVPGASWRTPEGPGSSILDRDDHPVVQVSPEDAEAYARWAGGRLPTEAEWEFAARSGVTDGSPWDEPYDPVSGWKANVWQGAFPATDLKADGHHGSAPVASYAANAYGLHDMLGNVWEHVSDWWVPSHPDLRQIDPDGPPEALAAQFSHPEIGAQRVVKGGSWLCAPSYCMRYRPTARQPAETGLGSNHTGFRIAQDLN
jgi:formylglycine-generating enzyme required for sulfatase activity